MYRVILDTETANDLDHPLVYDFGYVIVDNNFKVVEVRNYLIKEVFSGMSDLMQSCYYNKKIPMYRKMLEQNEIIELNFLTIYDEFKALCKQYKIKEVWAFNASFDRKALNNTIETLSNGYQRYFNPYQVKWCCIQHAAAQTVCNSPRYFNYCIKNNLITPKGYVSTKVESIYPYLSKDYDFIEDHTALSDSIVECYILERVKKQHKKFDKRPNKRAYLAPDKKFQEWKKEKGL